VYKHSTLYEVLSRCFLTGLSDVYHLVIEYLLRIQSAVPLQCNLPCFTKKLWLHFVSKKIFLDTQKICYLQTTEISSCKLFLRSGSENGLFTYASSFSVPHK
jgi:hypothetical protein